MGRNFYYAGIWTADVEYTLTDFSAPFVILRETGQPDFYYVMQGENRTIIGNPHKPSNTNTDWHEMEASFKYLITEAMFTNFAKLGASIFNEDYMFSQYGYMVGYNGVREKIETDTQYQYAEANDMDAKREITTIKQKSVSATLAPATNESQSIQKSVTALDDRLYAGIYYTFEIDVRGEVTNNRTNITIKVQGNTSSTASKGDLSGRIILLPFFFPLGSKGRASLSSTDFRYSM